MLDHKTSHIQIVYIENNKLKIFCVTWINNWLCSFLPFGLSLWLMENAAETFFNKFQGGAPFISLETTAK